MSVYSLASRVSSIEYSVDELAHKADSNDAVLTGTTTINGPTFLNGPVALGGIITGIDVVDVMGLQNALDLKAPKESPVFTGTVSGISKGMIGLGNVDNTSDIDKPLSNNTMAMFQSVSQAFDNVIGREADNIDPVFTGTVSGITKGMVGLGNVDNTADASKPVSSATQIALDLKAPLASPVLTRTVSGITKAMAGLSPCS